MRDTQFSLYVVISVLLCVPLISSAASSQNYVLDSAIIGNLGTTDASSLNYSSDSTGVPSFYHGEDIDTESSDIGSNGGGPRITIVPRDVAAHVYTETGPLSVKDSQSGTFVRTFTAPDEYVTLYISPNATTPQGVSGDAAIFTIDRRTMGANDVPTSIPAAAIVGGTVYTVDATRDGELIDILRKYLTLIIETPALTNASASTHTVYYFHPKFKAWIKMPNAVPTGDAVIFQTPFVTDYIIVDLTKSGAIPAIIRTPLTPAIPDAMIVGDIAETHGEVTQTEIREADASTTPKTPENTEPYIVQKSIIQSFLDFLKGHLGNRITALGFLTIPPALVILGGLLIYLIRRH